MKQQRIAGALAASLAISAVCTFLLARSMRNQITPAKTPDLLYAAPSRALQAGEILKPESLEMVSWPNSRPLHGAFAKTDGLLGRALLFPLEKDQPILDQDVSAAGVSPGLAAKIPAGMRAIALRSDEVVGVAGFLTPGSHVDVLGTFHTANSPDPVTSIVLENAEVLAVGQRAQPDPEGKPSPAVTVVTLLLTPEEAERAVLATSQGSVHFVLRNGADLDEYKGTPMMLSMLSGVAAPAKPAVEAPPHAPVRIAAPREAEIETVLGDGPASRKVNGTAP